MYSFVYQKINLGKEREVSSLSWNKENDLIAVGFSTKALKLIKIEDPSDLDGEIQLSLNQTITSSHKGQVATVSWNEEFDKLLSVDDKGLMIVWTEGGPNAYTEEMVNEAGKKRIKFAKWSAQGTYVIIVIEGGSLILGSVEGERLWGKDLQMEIEFVSFLENDQVILVGDSKGGLIALDHRKGEVFAEYDFYDEANDSKGKTEGHNKVALFEANNSLADGRIAIGFERGQIYFVNDLRENFLKKYEYGLQKLFAAKWTREGKLLAISCLIEDKPRIFFLNHHAEIVSCLTVAKSVLFLDFNAAGDRLLTGFQNSLSFIKVKRICHYCFLSKEGVFVVAFEVKQPDMELQALEKKLPAHYYIYFADVKSKTFKQIEAQGLLFLASDVDKVLAVTADAGKTSGCTFRVHDKNGNLLHSLKLKCTPEHVAFKNSRVLFSMSCYIGVWDLSEALKIQIQAKGLLERPKLYGFSLSDPATISDCTLATDTIFEDSKGPGSSQKSFSVVCIEITETSYIVCTSAGLIKRFNVNNFSESEDLVMRKAPRRVFINRQETAIACIDSYNNIDVALLKSILGSPGNYKPCYSSENSTDFQWSENGSEFCFTKKNRVYEKSLADIIQNTLVAGPGVELAGNAKEFEKVASGIESASEIAQTCATVIGYHQMNIYMADLDLLHSSMQEQRVSPEPNFSSALTNHKSCKLSLIDSFILAKGPVDNEKADSKLEAESSEEEISKDLSAFLLKQKDSQYYNYAAQLYLQQGKFELAEKLYVQLENYTALKFIERMRNGLENESVKRAEALLFIKKPKEAVALLVSKNLSNLVPRLLLAYGEYTGIEDFLSNVDMHHQNKVLKELGEMYVVKGKLAKAIKIFEKLDDKFTLMHLYFSSGNYDKLYSMINDVKTKEGLVKLAELLIQVGNADLAARAFEKAGESKRAVDIAILNNYWSTAVEIAERNDFKQIDGIIHRSASLLVDKRKKLELVELYRKARKNVEASRILNSLASDLIDLNINPLAIKKVFVLAAIEVHLHNKKSIDPNITANLTNVTLSEMTKDITKRAMTTLITSDLNSAGDRALSNPWRGAEAWHYYVMALRFIKTGNYKQSVKVAFKLMNYELELGETRVYAVLAVSAYYVRFFRSFSRAVSRLELIYQANGKYDLLQKLEEITVRTFMEKAPKDEESPKTQKFSCVAKSCANTVTEFDICCKACGSNFSTCVFSGNTIFVKEYTKCNVCKQKVLSSEVSKNGLQHCPLCHTKLRLPDGENRKA